MSWRISLVALVALAVPAVVAPVSVAQNGTGMSELQITADAPVFVAGAEPKNGRLMPETAETKIKFSFDVTVPAVQGCVIPITVTFKPKWDAKVATVHLSNPSVTRTFDGDSGANGPLDPYASPGGTVLPDWTTEATVQLTRDAPAFKQVHVAVEAQALSGATEVSDRCTLRNSLARESTHTVVADYVPRMQYQPRTYMANAGQNGQVVFALQAVNHGNGPTKVKTSINEKTKGLESVTPPVETILESKVFSGATARDSEVIQITARTPHHNGYTNKIYVLEATFLARADTSFQPGELAEDQRSVTLSVKVQGVYVPGFDAASLVGALGIALVGLGTVGRRRR